MDEVTDEVNLGIQSFFGLLLGLLSLSNLSLESQGLGDEVVDILTSLQ